MTHEKVTARSEFRLRSSLAFCLNKRVSLRAHGIAFETILLFAPDGRMPPQGYTPVSKQPREALCPSRRTTSHEGCPGSPQSLRLPLKRAPKIVSALETSHHTVRGKSSENGSKASPESPNVLLPFPESRRPGGY